MKFQNTLRTRNHVHTIRLGILALSVVLLIACQDKQVKSQIKNTDQASSKHITKDPHSGINQKQKSNKRYQELTQSDSLVPLDQFFSPDTQAFAFMQPSLKPLKGVGGVEAQDCKKCHVQIYEEWQQTTHSSALHDLQFQAELTKEDSPKWLCLNCHIPNQDQREYIVTGLDSGNVLRPVIEPNPNFKKSFQQEAINCAVCHLRQDEKGETIVLGALGNTTAPHPVQQDRQALRNTCLRCHDPKGESITPNLMCWFKTKDELQANPQARGQDCVSCHMPTRPGSIVQGGPNRMRHLHHWVGGGVPKHMSGFDSLKARGYKSGLEVEAVMKSSELQLRLKNNSGHAIPTADPERYYRVQVTQKSGDQIVTDTVIRIGQIWEWSPAKKVGDTRLQGGEQKTFNSSLLPENIHEVEVLVSHHKLSVENLKHMKLAKIDTDLYPGGQEKILEMEKHYPRFRFTHKITFTRDPDLGVHLSNPADWVMEKYSFEQLNQLSIEKNQILEP